MIRISWSLLGGLWMIILCLSMVKMLSFLQSGAWQSPGTSASFLREMCMRQSAGNTPNVFARTMIIVKTMMIPTLAMAMKTTPVVLLMSVMLTTVGLDTTLTTSHFFAERTTTITIHRYKSHQHFL